MQLTMPTPVANFLDNIKINATTTDTHAGHPMFLKRRSWLTRRVANLANFYFWMASIPIRFATNSADWQRREIDTFIALNPGYEAIPVGRSATSAEKLPGEALFTHLKRGTLTREMLVAAAKEFRRCHAINIPGQTQPFSHADATMSNVIFDEETGAARLIDFEISHHKSLTPTQRQADDLLVFLLDLAGYTYKQDWLPFATTFLKTYNNPEVVNELKTMLPPPRGLARIWWHVRTNFVNPKKLQSRLQSLQAALTNPRS